MILVIVGAESSFCLGILVLYHRIRGAFSLLEKVEVGWAHHFLIEKLGKLC